jgi:hypothetical protein
MNDVHVGNICLVIRALKYDRQVQIEGTYWSICRQGVCVHTSNGSRPEYLNWNVYNDGVTIPPCPKASEV